jgi:hypothetical protein
MQIATTGLVFTFRSRYYKLLDVEWRTDTPDNSFYFLPRQHEDEVGNRIGMERDASGRLVLAIDTLNTGCFPMRKVSRHQSGVFHIKDTASRSRKGKREKDGLRGPAFQDIAFWTILAVAPQAIETLLEVPGPLPTDVQIHLPATVTPFTVQFAVWDKRTPIPPFPSGGDLLGGIITIDIANKTHGLTISVLPVVKTSAPETPSCFPARTFYIVQ